jgi:hypothetical protein
MKLKTPGIVLDPVKVVETADALSRRIRERFPSSGLGAVSLDVALYARGAESLSASLGKPQWALRIASALVTVALALGVLLGLSRVHVKQDVGDISNFVQGVDALLQSAVYACVTVWFFVSLESRLKRNRVLRELRALRSLAHVVDMHQLDKDPMVTLFREASTKSSPKHKYTRFELSRYLEYCSELLAITAKLAALYVQGVPDPFCLEAASDIENLCIGHSQKIWQKIEALSPKEPVNL